MTCTIISDGQELKTKCRNEHEEPLLTVKRNLRETIWWLYCKGYNEFYVNCEYGIPLWAAEIIVALKLYNKISLNIIVPFEEQCRDWSESDRDRYYDIHERADTVEFACTAYDDECYDLADKMMIDESDMVIIFGKAEKAEYYARKIGIEVNMITI